jgi:hypothetical protein
MSTGVPVNDYAVPGYLTVNTPDQSTAQTTGLTAIGDINTALGSLNNNTSLSAAEVEGTTQSSPQLAWERAGSGQQWVVQVQLLVGAANQGSAQAAAEAAVSSINTAISGVSPAVSVSLETSEGQYVFSQL